MSRSEQKVIASRYLILRTPHSILTIEVVFFTRKKAHPAAFEKKNEYDWNDTAVL
jgi:hypothetical protein